MSPKFRVLAWFLLIGAFVLAACAAQSSGPQTIEVTLTEFGIQSSVTEFSLGQTYRFVITNAGSLNHEFTLMPATGSSAMEGEHDMGEMGHDMSGAMLHVGEDKLTPGATVTIDYIFTAAIDEGEFEFACHLPGHYEAGMFTAIEIDA